MSRCEREAFAALFADNSCLEVSYSAERRAELHVETDLMGEQAERDEVLLDVTRVLMGVSVRSAAMVEDKVSSTQLRTLTLLKTLGRVNLATLSSALGIVPSATSRLCDRLVEAGLIDRTPSRETRREIALSISRAGDRVLREVDRHRVEQLSEIFQRIPAKRRPAVLAAFGEFARAASTGSP